MTFIIAIPSGIKVFNWITTLYAGKIKFSVPMLFCLSFIIMFTFGGITGVYINIIALDLYLHGSYWVVGHFHFVVAAGTLQAMFAAFYYYFPDMTGKMYHEATARIHFWLWSIGNFFAFFGFTMLGYYGMPRRYYTYNFLDESHLQNWHRFATVGAFMMGLSFLFFLSSLLLGYFQGEEIKNMDDPFELGEGYDFPKPYAQHIKETTGETVHINHSLSLWAPLGAIMLSFPLLAIAAFAEAGPFSKKDPATGEEGSLRAILDPSLWMYIFVGGFVAFLLAAFYAHINAEIKEPTFVDIARKGDRNWEIWTFLGSETIFFGALIGSGIAMRMQVDNWGNPNHILNVPLTAVNTFVLIVSSFTMAKALDAAEKGDQERLKRFLLFTIILGTIFVTVQAIEYRALVHEGEIFLSKDGKVSDYATFASVFFLSTGFHGAHVTVGVLFLILVYFRARKGAYTKENHEYVEFIGLYWHFVDLVWVVLFTVLYLI
jgi:cytochrome c oxidase subunit I+III